MSRDSRARRGCCRICGMRRTRRRSSDRSAGIASVPIQPARRGSAHHQFRRRQHQLEVRPDWIRCRASRRACSPSRAAAAISGPWARRGSRCCTSTSSSSSSIAIAARRTRTRWSGTTRCARSATTASPRRSTRRCMRFCRSITSITSIPTGRSPWPPARMATGRSKSSTGGTGAASSGCRGSGRASSWR